MGAPDAGGSSLLTRIARRLWTVRCAVGRLGQSRPLLDLPPGRPPHDVETHRAWREASVTKAARSLPEVTVVCVTNRPDRLDHAIENYERQRYDRKRLLLVTNSSRFEDAHVAARLAHLERASAMSMDETVTLGGCLNAALGSCETPYFAKFDDDDRYGPGYLLDMMLAHLATRAVVVGKRTYLAHLERTGRYLLRFPGHEFSYTSFVSGATLVVDLQALGDTRFPEVDVGEDTGFIDRCRRGGRSVFSGDRFNYLQTRGSENTWRVSNERYAAAGVPVDEATVDDALGV